MTIKFFAVQAIEPGEAENDLNRFVRSHRIVSIDRQLVTTYDRPVWYLAVEYVESGVPFAGGSTTGGGDYQRPRIDYKQTLPPADFAVFNKLREARKQISDQEGLPVFAIFTNEQLAAIAQKRPQSVTELQQIEGVGAGKGSRYGERVCEVLKTLPPVETTAVIPAPTA